MSRPDWLPDSFAWHSGLSVDLGAGRFPRNPLRAKRLVAVDVLHEAAFQESGDVEYRRVNPGAPLPVDTGEADCCTAYDFIEHIPRFDRSPDGEPTNPFIDVMNEVYRVLKPDGVFIAITPCFPKDAAFTDPTHVNFITPGTHEYFSGHVFARALGYGFEGDFTCLQADWLAIGSPLWECVDDGKRDHLESDPLDQDAQVGLRNRIAQAPVIRRFSRYAPYHFLWVLKKT